MFVSFHSIIDGINSINNNIKDINYIKDIITDIRTTGSWARPLTYLSQEGFFVICMLTPLHVSVIKSHL